MEEGIPSNFQQLPPQQRRAAVAAMGRLSPEESRCLGEPGGLPMEVADHMIEHAIGIMPVPLGVALNFTINGKDRVIPMALEEPGIVATASNMAALVRKTGGFSASCPDPVMYAQIQAIGVADPHSARVRILEAKDEILRRADAVDPKLIEAGGGAVGLEVRVVESQAGPMVVTHLLVDVRDAMGANAVNTMAETLAPFIEQLTGGRVLLRILSNLADRRLARARCVVGKDDLGGADVVDAIVTACRFAQADRYRATTHNKGIMNGIIPVVLATGNDTRAIEAGAHAYAARPGGSSTLTCWEKNAAGDVAGMIELPMAVGLVGGATRAHPVARANIKLLDVHTAAELGEVIACVGLAVNLGALLALATKGIQSLHMTFHARTLAATAGAPPELADSIAETMIHERRISLERAQELLRHLQLVRP